MVDASHIDLVSLIERKAGITVVDRKPVNARNFQTGEVEREVHSNCPWCPGSKDSFIIKVDKGWFSHAIRSRGCGRSGDAITFLYEWEGTGFLDACEELGITLDSSLPNVLPTRKAYRPEYPPQSKKWRDTADIKLSRAQGLIQTGIGLEYARKRGFTDGTILDWRLGYVPFRDDKQRFFTIQPDEWGIPAESGGKNLYMYEGLLIPWFVKGKVWKLQVRRISGQIDPKYKILPIKGSVEHCLFNQDALRDDKPVVLVESALCAISGSQEAGDLATFIATGGAKQNQYEHNVSLLARAPVVLVAFDNDENKAGSNGARYWKENLPHAFRWHPWGHDINDMLISGQNIRAWVEIGLASAELEQKDTEGQSFSVHANQTVTRESTDEQASVADQEVDVTRPSDCSDEVVINEETEQAYQRYSAASDLLEELLTYGIKLTYRSDGEPEFVGSRALAFPKGIQEDFYQRVMRLDAELRYLTSNDPLHDPVVQKVMEVFDARLIEVIPRAKWEERKAEIFQQKQDQAEQQKRERDRAKWRGKNDIPESVWFSIPRGDI